MPDTEQWRPVPGFPDYEVSNTGRVLSHKSGAPRLLTIHRSNGRLSIKLCRDGGVYMHRVHSLVAAAFIGPRPEGLQVCHNDGDKDNNRASNLRYDTPSANSRDAVLHGVHRNTRKDGCPQGHPYDEVNTYYWRTARLCRTCRRENNRRAQARQALRAANVRSAA